ncbi:MAG: PEP-utilizing enzyme [Patescibacteria group bacterium]
MNNLPKGIKQKEWHYLGQWIDNVLDTDFWIHWAETDVLGKITDIKCSSNRISLHGHFFFWKATYDAVSQESYDAARQKRFSYFDNFCSVTKSVIDELEILKDALAKKREFSPEDLQIFFTTFQKLYTPWLIIFPIADGLEKYLTEKTKEARMDVFSLGAHFHPSEDPEMTKQIKEVRSFVQMLGEKGVLHILQQKSIGDARRELANVLPNFTSLIQDHLKKYAWVGVHHFWGSPLTEEKILQEMRELSKQYPFAEDQAEKPAVSSEIQELITVMNKLSYWRFRCAETSGYVVYHFLPRLKEISGRLGVTYEEMCWLSREEIFGTLKGDRELDKSAIRERRKTFGYTYIDGKEIIFSGKLVTQLLDVLGIGVAEETTTIKGNVACKGYAQGIVRVVKEPKNVGAFLEGEILVSPETTPDFLPAMKKAAAFIADIGGLTSHAAIIARELKKPCIIGTKIATQVLKDGDLVEVDAERGVVRILEKARANKE